MAAQTMNVVLQHLRSLLGEVHCDDMPDAELLARFARHRDEAAFEVLVRRYGSLVHGLCRRILRDDHAAEDAFQATFLVLASKADSIRKQESLGSWLYGVALRVAKDARAKSGRRRTHERQAVTMRCSADGASEPMTTQPDFSDQLADFEARNVLDEELSQLPEKYRTPLFLCYLQGMTNAEAARQLGRPAGSMSWTLERARELLRGRMAKRGIALTSVALVGLLDQNANAAGVSSALVRNTVQAALARAAGHAAASTPAALLAEGVLQAMFMHKVRTVSLALVLVALVGSGTGALVHEALAEMEQPQAKVDAPPAAVGEKRTDTFGDPLPGGALTRFGTSRWRNESVLGFTEDSKGVITLTIDHGTFNPLNVAMAMGLGGVPDAGDIKAPVAKPLVRIREIPSGKEMRRFEIKGESLQCVLSPNGKVLAALESTGKLRLWDMTQGKELREVAVAKNEGNAQQGQIAIAVGGAGGMFSFAGATTALNFTSDSKSLAYKSPNGKAVLIDVENGKEIRSFEPKVPEEKVEANEELFQGEASGVAAAPGGKHIATSTQQGTIALFDAKSGKELHSFKSEAEYPIFGDDFLFTQDGKTLIARDMAGLHFFDVETGKKSKTIKIAETDSLQRMRLSPDGKKIAARHSQSSSIAIWDLATEKKAELGFTPEPMDQNGALAIAGMSTMGGGSDSSLAFSGEGKLLAAGGMPFHIWDLATGKDLLAETGHQQPIIALAFSSDGKSAATVGEDWTVRTWDRGTGKQQSSFTLPNDVFRVALDRHGKFLATGSSKGEVQLWDIASGKAKCTFKDHKEAIEGLSFSADGKVLASFEGGTVYLWDVAKEKQLHHVALDVKADPNDPMAGLIRMAMLGGRGPTLSADSHIALSADGSLVFWTKGAQLQIIRATTGHVLHTLEGKVENQGAAAAAGIDIEGMEAFAMNVRTSSRDGRMIAWSDSGESVTIFEASTGKKRVRIELPKIEAKKEKKEEKEEEAKELIPGFPMGLLGSQFNQCTTLAFSPDDRILAGALQDGSIRLWNVATGKELATLAGHKAGVRVLAFAADGKTLATGGADTTSLVWDVSQHQAKEIDGNANLDECWKDLMQEDGTKAFTAILRLARSGKEGVSLIEKQLPPTPAPDAKAIARLVDDLDSNDFKTRDDATQSLIRIGKPAEPAVRRELEKHKDTLELRRRLEKILGQIRDEAVSNDTIREIRAIEVLERLGSPEAKAALQSLAKGAEGARLTTEAQNALERLK